MAETMLAMMDWTAIEANGGMRGEIRVWAATFPDRDALEAAMEPMKLPVGAIKRLADIPDEPWAIERGAYTTVEDRSGGTLRLPFSPLRATGYAVGVQGRPATQGESNAAVMSSVLGLDAVTIERRRNEGVLVEPDGAPH